MHPTLQLLDRFSDELKSQPVHWFDLPENTQLLKESDRIYCIEYRDDNNIAVNLNDWPTAKLNILFYPKSKDRLTWWLRRLQTTLTDAKKLWIVGENNGGIKSLANRLKGHFNCTKLDSARHCALFEIQLLNPLEEADEWQRYSVSDLPILSLPGVFSANRLDKGTEVLLNVLPTLKGSVLEFGGGSGVLTTLVAKQPTVSKVIACEIDLLAVHSSKETLKLNSVASKADTIWSNGLKMIPAEKFDVVITNPPFHKGISTSYNASETLFAEASKWLKPGGQLIWVANEFLSYQSIIEAHFSSIKILAHEKGFKVFQATL